MQSAVALDPSGFDDDGLPNPDANRSDSGSGNGGGLIVAVGAAVVGGLVALGKGLAKLFRGRRGGGKKEPPKQPPTQRPETPPADVPRFRGGGGSFGGAGATGEWTPRPADPVTVGRSRLFPRLAGASLGESDTVTRGGLAIRATLRNHLSGPDGFQRGRLHGTHNMTNAVAAVRSKNATFELQPTQTPGIYVLRYEYQNENGKTISGTKTVYDPAVYSDDRMLNMAVEAAIIAANQYFEQPSVTKDVWFDGVHFRVYFNKDKDGNIYVGNVHPIV